MAIVAQRTAAGDLKIAGSLTEDDRQPVFSRPSVAYKQDGTQVAAGNPRFEAGKFAQAVMVEEGATNLLTANQSSVETDLVGFTALAGATLARDTANYWHGTASLRATSPGSAAGEGFETTSVAVTASRSYIASVYLKGSGTVVLGLQERDSADALIGLALSPVVTLTGSWQRVSVRRAFGTSGVRARLQVHTYTAQAVTFYTDGLQLEQRAWLTSWTLGGSTRSAEILNISTVGVLNKEEGTIELWINPIVVRDWNNFFSMSPLSTGRFLLFFTVDGTVCWDYGPSNSGLHTGTGVAVAGEWLHVAMRWSASSGSRELFVNGQYIGTRAFTPPDSLPSIVTVVNSLGALIDDLRISSRARSDTEIQAAYQANAPLGVDEWTTLKVAFDGSLFAAAPTQITSVGDLKITGELIEGAASFALGSTGNVTLIGEIVEEAVL